jgi:hypothetical protein
MKKATGAVLFLGLLLNLLIPLEASAQAANWKQTYKKYILDYIQSDGFNQDSVITLIDLDRDGVPELIGGEDYRIINRIDFAYTFKKGQSLRLTHQGPGIGEESPIGFRIGMHAFTKGNLNLYKDKKSGKLQFVGTDGVGGIAGSDVGDYVIQLTGTVLKTYEISRHYTEEGVKDEYTFKGNKVTKSAYDAKRKSYYASLAKTSVQPAVLSGSDILNSDNAEDAIDRLLGLENERKAELGKNLYPQMPLEDKKALMRFLGNFPAEVEQFDITHYTDDELVGLVSNNTMKYGIGPLADRDPEPVTRPRTFEDGSTADWTYYGYPEKDVNDYIQSLFGVVPKQASSAYLENGTYYFPDWAAGGGSLDVPELEGVYALGNGLYYLELTRYAPEMDEWDYDKWVSFGDFQHTPIENWSAQTKAGLTLTKEGFWHAIVRKTQDDSGSVSWHLVEYRKNKKMTKAELDEYVRKLQASGM